MYRANATRSARRAAVLTMAMLGAFAPGPRAAAHALLAGTVPQAGAIVPRAPRAVTLTFTEAPEPTLSIVHVLDREGRPVERGPAVPVRGAPLDVEVPLGELPRGVFTVTWRTVSRVDGHVAGGAFAFGVGTAPAAVAPRTASPPPSPLYVSSRVLLYAGLCGMLGAAALALVGEPFAGVGERFLWGCWTAAALGVLLLGLAQADDTGAGVRRLLQTPLGRALWARGLPVAAAAPVVGFGVRRGRGRRWPWLILGALALLSMLAQVIAGHPGAATGLREWSGVLAQWSHFAAAGVWVGALIGLVAVARSARPSAAAMQGLSAGAAAALVAVALTGALRATDEIGSRAALASTLVGQLVLVKTALFILLGALGAATRRAVLARGRPDGTRFGRVVGAEFGVALAVFAVTAYLTGLAVPAGSPVTVARSQISAVGSDYATSVRVRLTAAPGVPGINRFTAAVTDYDTGRPVAADRVALQFAKPDRPDVGRSVLTLVRDRDGAYRGQGANLTLDGPWSVVVLVQRGRNSVEVPLQLFAQGPPAAVRTITAPGRPTLYVVDLAEGRTLTLYLDPDRPGFNGVHLTFADGRGHELTVAGALAVTAARPGGNPRVLPVLQEGPGHFYADFDFGAGAWLLRVVGATPSGETLRAQVPIRL